MLFEGYMVDALIGLAEGRKEVSEIYSIEIVLDIKSQSDDQIKALNIKYIGKPLQIELWAGARLKAVSEAFPEKIDHCNAIDQYESLCTLIGKYWREKMCKCTCMKNMFYLFTHRSDI